VETLSSNAHPVHSGLIQDVVTFWRWPPLFDVGETNSECALGCMGLHRILRDALTPCVQAKDHSSSNLKLIILLFGITTRLLSHTSHYHLLPQRGMLRLTPCVCWQFGLVQISILPGGTVVTQPTQD
jgi:hypothetical protein